MGHLNRSGFDALHREKQVLVTVWLFESKVANGGFAIYYHARAGDLAHFAPAALAEEINAPQLAALAAKANAVFGSAGPPQYREARRPAMDGLDPAAKDRWKTLEERFFECPQDCDELM